jgi:single-strand DNA-binding protein
MPLPRVVIEGRMATEPELRFLPSGVAVCNFRVAASQRKLNQQTNQWEDDKQCFLSVACWRDMAENVASSLHRGDGVVIIGRMYEEQYEREGQQRTSFKVDADSCGPDLRWAEATMQRTQRTQAGQQPQPDPWATQPAQGQQRPAQAPQQQPQQQQQQPQQGGWQQGNQQGWGNQPSYDEPPFFAPPTVIS